MKANQIRRIERLSQRRVVPNLLVSPELARQLTELSRETGRQLGLLLDRRGQVYRVMLGTAKDILLPDLSDYRPGSGRLRGLRFIHTHLRDEPLSDEDLTDLALLRLDAVAAINAQPDGLPGAVHEARLLPSNGTNKNWDVLPPRQVHALPADFLEATESLEEELERVRSVSVASYSSPRAILVSVTSSSWHEAEDSMLELADLAWSAGLEVVDKIIQRRSRSDDRLVMGRGKLRDLIVRTVQLGADEVVFDQDLSPAQVRAIGDYTDVKVIDRTTLILDIFAQRANSGSAKVQVELAQLKYLLPRLEAKDTGMSRLTGGVRLRGPGETKLEISRRRVRDRIAHLERELEHLSKGRKQRRALRTQRHMPIVSIVGYTNAGKSTLLNALTLSDTTVGDRMFETLDSRSRRLRFPQQREIIVTDTVGFIRHLPEDLVAAFHSTLEELEDADLILHVVDISDPNMESRMEAVEAILGELGLATKPRLVILNKTDLVSETVRENLRHRWDAVTVSALGKIGLDDLLARIEATIWPELFETTNEHELAATNQHESL